VLDLSVSKLETFCPAMYYLYPKHDFQNLRVLVLRSNLINELMPLQLVELTNLTDLDMSFNKISGVIPRAAFPQSIERLDLSSNDITDLTYMSGYPFLLVMNVSNNCIKEISVYPPNLTHLDISENLINNVIDLRILALTPSIKILQISGNPVLNNSNQCKVTVCSVLPRLVMLDDLIIPSRNARLKNNAALAQSIKDRNSQAANNKKIQEKADAVRSRSHALKLRANEVERAVKNREIDEMANQTNSAEKHRKDMFESAEELSGVHSNASRSKGSSNVRSSEGKGGSNCSEKREPFAVFGLTR
jgi:Leucine-rich repeat (LRR) protein